MIKISPAGSDLVLSGTDSAGAPLQKRLHVTPAFRCADHLKYRLDPDTGHQTLEVEGLTDLAKAAGFSDLKDETKPQPLSKSEEDALARLSEKAAKAKGQPLATAMTTKSAKPAKAPEPTK